MYTISQLHVEIQEIVYFNSDTLYRLLNFASSLKERIDLSVSTAEDLSKLFPKALIEVKPWMMARLNDSNLFNKLFHVSVFNGQEAYMIAKKPLFNPDFQ
jgi:predicted acetyltransferase